MNKYFILTMLGILLIGTTTVSAYTINWVDQCRTTSMCIQPFKICPIGRICKPCVITTCTHVQAVSDQATATMIANRLNLFVLPPLSYRTSIEVR